MHRINALIFFLAIFFLSGCLTADYPYSRLAPGRWRAILELEKNLYPQKDARNKDVVIVRHEQTQPGELPFNFEVSYTNDTAFYIEIVNGTERIRCEQIRWGRDRTTARDTIFIDFPEYQSYISADVRGDLMSGKWVVTTKKNYQIPFRAKAGQDFRFTTLKTPPVTDISGNWATLFGLNEDQPYAAIGEFQQTGNRLTGTFRTETGDFRFLEGTVQGNKLAMSCFDGSHAFLFTGKIVGDTLLGEFRSGNHYKTLWKAWRDPSFRLRHADSLTLVLPAATRQNVPFSFTFTNSAGKAVSFPSPQWDGKVKIITVSGTWCPNCRDEHIFLRDFLRQHPDVTSKIAVVSLQFERFRDTAQALAHLDKYRRHLQLPYDLLLAGNAHKDDAAKTLPFLNHVMAFPTLIILDKKNVVRRVHTGFDGPATSQHAHFQADFEKRILSLVAE